MPPHRSTLAEHATISPVLPQFIARLSVHVRMLRELYASGNIEEFRRLIHQLKGAGASYGFPPISHNAAGIQERLDAGSPLADILPTLEEMIAYIEQIEGYRP
jgi:HPt (histidine-containing phosphotransfer) domain-containing protein